MRDRLCVKLIRGHFLSPDCERAGDDWVYLILEMPGVETAVHGLGQETSEIRDVAAGLESDPAGIVACYGSPRMLDTALEHGLDVNGRMLSPQSVGRLSKEAAEG